MKSPHAALDQWNPFALSEALSLFDGAPSRWSVSGGHALELHAGRSWRQHEDLTIGSDDDDRWIYRRDPSLRRPWSGVVLTARRVPYLAPDLQLLFKSKRPRPRDDLDAQTVIPLLG